MQQTSLKTRPTAHATKFTGQPTTYLDKSDFLVPVFLICPFHIGMAVTNYFFDNEHHKGNN